MAGLDGTCFMLVEGVCLFAGGGVCGGGDGVGVGKFFELGVGVGDCAPGLLCELFGCPCAALGEEFVDCLGGVGFSVDASPDAV